MIWLVILLISCSVRGMSAPEVSVISVDQTTYTWYLDQEEIDQMSSLRNQQECGQRSPVILAPAVSPENFTQLLPFLARKSDSAEITKNKKRALGSKTLNAIAQCARDADCLGAERLLRQSLKILRDRIGAECALTLPETLQRALNEQVVRKNPFIKLLLFKAFDGNHAIHEMQEPKSLSVIMLLSSHAKNSCMIHDYMVKRRVSYNDGTRLDSRPWLVLCEILPDDTSKLLKMWNIPKPLQSCMAHENGVVALHRDNSAMFGYPTDRHIFFYNKDSDEPRLFAPFRTCPTALILDSHRKKIIAGSLEGEVGIFDLEHPEVEPQILGSVSNVLVDQDKKVNALAIDSKGEHVAAGNAECTIGIWSLPEKKYKELANTGSGIDDIKFGTADNLLFVMTFHKGLQIWSIDSQTALYTLPIRNYEGPSGRKPSTLFIHPHDTKVTLYGHYAARERLCTLFDEQTYKELKCVPLSTIAFLVRVGKKIHEDKQITFADEPDLQKLYRSVPLALQKIIAKKVSWRDWIWL